MNIVILVNKTKVCENIDLSLGKVLGKYTGHPFRSYHAERKIIREFYNHARSQISKLPCSDGECIDAQKALDIVKEYYASISDKCTGKSQKRAAELCLNTIANAISCETVMED